MGCEEIRDLLPLVAGGEARDHERVAVEEHASHCAPCARELDLFREARANLALLREGDAPAGTWKSIWAGVRSDLYPSRASHNLFLFDQALRHAAVLMVGLAVGVGAYVATRPARPAAAPAEAVTNHDLVSGVELRPGPLQPVTGQKSAPFHVEAAPRMKFYAPRANPDGSSYLPRVEAMPVGGERDF